MRFYKGVGVGTFLHPKNFQGVGFVARSPGANRELDDVVTHISAGTPTSPFVSATKSYGVAENYARNASKSPPTPSNPAYVYVIDVPDPLPPGVAVIDPIAFIASHRKNSVTDTLYSHDGDQQFLASVADPLMYPGPQIMKWPPGMGGMPRAPNLSGELEAIVYALRDAEILIVGGVPGSWVTHRHDIK